MIYDGKDDTTYIATGPSESCSECGEKHYPEDLTSVYGPQLCRKVCAQRYEESEARDGGPFKVVINEDKSFYTGALSVREYDFTSLSEARLFAKIWNGKVWNSMGIELINE